MPTVMNFRQYSEEFLNYSRIERGLSNNSISAYTRDLQRFSDFIAHNSMDFLALQQEELDYFLIELNKIDLATS